jgi:hypothetical protein
MRPDEIRSVLIIVVALTVYDLGKLFLLELAAVTWATINMMP